MSLIKNKVKLWMLHNVQNYDNSTKLAEEAAAEFDLYEDDIDYVIPKYVFEMSAEFYTIDY